MKSAPLILLVFVYAIKCDKNETDKEIQLQSTSKIKVEDAIKILEKRKEVNPVESEALLWKLDWVIKQYNITELSLENDDDDDDDDDDINEEQVLNEKKQASNDKDEKQAPEHEIQKSKVEKLVPMAAKNVSTYETQSFNNNRFISRYAVQPFNNENNVSKDEIPAPNDEKLISNNAIQALNTEKPLPKDEKQESKDNNLTSKDEIHETKNKTLIPKDENKPKVERRRKPNKVDQFDDIKKMIMKYSKIPTSPRSPQMEAEMWARSVSDGLKFKESFLATADESDKYAITSYI